jgi:hypothetical protein
MLTLSTNDPLSVFATFVVATISKPSSWLVSLEMVGGFAEAVRSGREVCTDAGVTSFGRSNSRLDCFSQAIIELLFVDNDIDDDFAITHVDVYWESVFIDGDRRAQMNIVTQCSLAILDFATVL